MTTQGQTVLRKALVTEKAYAQASDQTYVFSVDLAATKTQVRQAVQRIYNVKVEDVRVAVIRGKVKRTRMGLGKRQNVKKAYVTIEAGKTLPVYQEI